MMSISCEWAIEGHVVRLLWEGDISKEDVQHLDQELILLMDQHKSELVHIISDNTRIGSEPNPKFYLQQSFLKHPHLGWWISLRNADTSQLNLNLVGQILKIRYRIFLSEDEAWAFLHEADASIPA